MDMNVLKKLVSDLNEDKLVLIKMNPNIYNRMVEEGSITKRTEGSNPILSVNVELDENVDGIEYVYSSDSEDKI